MRTLQHERRRLRLTVRALMAAVAAVSLVCAFFWVYLPWLRWRERIDRIVDKKLAAPDKRWGLFSAPGFQQLNSLTQSEYRDVLRDPRLVAERLMATSAKDPDPRRRDASLTALRYLLAESDSPALARDIADRVLRRAVAGTWPASDERAAIDLVENVVAYLGLDDAQRAEILARTAALARGPDPEGLLPFWVLFVGQIGGAAETEFLLKLDDARDPNSFTFNQGSRLMHSRSPFLLDHIRRWLDDPARASGALDYTILPFTSNGRALLLDVVLTPGRDAEVRKKAMRLLKRSGAGVALLVRACEDPDRRRILGQFYGPDGYGNVTMNLGLPAQIDAWALPPDLAEVKDANDPRPELRALRAVWDVTDNRWIGLVRGLDPRSWAGTKRRMLEEGGSAAEAEGAVRRGVAATLAFLRELSGRAELTTPAEWEQWVAATKPEPVSLRRCVDALLAHPEVLEFESFAEFPQRVRWIPLELQPACARLARAAPPGERWRLSLPLLLYCDRTEEAPLVIDDIEQELRDHPVRFAERNFMPIMILRYRFGVNCFWDVAAWRRWWAEYRSRAAEGARVKAAARKGA